MVTAARPSNNEPYLTVREVADLARCEHKAVRRAISSGQLLAFRVAGRLLVREADARAWIEARPVTGRVDEPVRTRLASKLSRPTRRPLPGSVADLRTIEREARPR
jgi:excisionase family DNA binding protein